MKTSLCDGLVKSPGAVIPAQAGIHKSLESLDPNLRRGDDKGDILAFYEAIKSDSKE